MALPVRPERCETDNLVVNKDVHASVKVFDDAEPLCEECSSEPLCPNIDGEDEEPDVEETKVAEDPQLPTEAEVEEHRARGHVPFRRWCIFCMRGRGLGEQHRGLLQLLFFPQSLEARAVVHRLTVGHLSTSDNFVELDRTCARVAPPAADTRPPPPPTGCAAKDRRTDATAPSTRG